jgi:hypothetical protein
MVIAPPFFGEAQANAHSRNNAAKVSLAVVRREGECLAAEAPLAESIRLPNF